MQFLDTYDKSNSYKLVRTVTGMPLPISFPVLQLMVFANGSKVRLSLCLSLWTISSSFRRQNIWQILNLRLPFCKSAINYPASAILNPLMQVSSLFIVNFNQTVLSRDPFFTQTPFYEPLQSTDGKPRHTNHQHYLAPSNIPTVHVHGCSEHGWLETMKRF